MMRKIINNLFVVCFLLVMAVLPYSAFAMLNMELTQGVAGAIPIAIVPLTNNNDLPQNISGILSQDLKNSGRFKVYDGRSITQFPHTASAISADYFRHLGTDNVVVGTVQTVGADRYQVKFELVSLFQDANTTPTALLTRQYTVPGSQLRAVAHHISDLIYQQITGTRGIFSTKIAYVVVQRSNAGARYVLEVADQDGYSPRPLLSSPEPIMSPSWSPNGREIAYVSFEKQHASIYLQDVITGGRRLLSEFEGINGAPAWSPDGRRLALVLSRTGSPNVYVINIATNQLSQVTHDFYINTEPAWSADGRSLLYTSDRGGGPQIYQVNLANGQTNRLTFDGDYNARASYTRDGKFIVMIHKVSGVYSIALLNLDSGTVKVLTGVAGNTTSPSVAPNGSMVLYDTYTGGRNVLGMVSSDGRVQLVLPAQNGDAQDPSWSPYLS